MIDFVIVSSDLRLHLLDTQVNRGLVNRPPPGGELDQGMGEASEQTC